MTFKAINTFIGKRNTSGLSLHNLEGHRFAMANLVSKLANICPDLSSKHLSGTSIFKTITAGDRLNDERQYAEAFEFDPFVRLVFSANFRPRSANSSPAFFQRWIVVPFERCFEPDEQIPTDVLDAKLADPIEQSGALNKAIDELPQLREERTGSPSRRRWSRFGVRSARRPIHCPSGWRTTSLRDQKYRFPKMNCEGPTTHKRRVANDRRSALTL